MTDTTTFPTTRTALALVRDSIGVLHDAVDVEVPDAERARLLAVVTMADEALDELDVRLVRP